MCLKGERERKEKEKEDAIASTGQLTRGMKISGDPFPMS